MKRFRPPDCMDTRKVPCKGYSLLEAQLAECQRERDALREALSVLYQHTKNNYVIAGLNTIAREALAATKENDGE